MQKQTKAPFNTDNMYQHKGRKSAAPALPVGWTRCIRHSGWASGDRRMSGPMASQRRTLLCMGFHYCGPRHQIHVLRAVLKSGYRTWRQSFTFITATNRTAKRVQRRRSTTDLHRSSGVGRPCHG
jgi:hypothetical protein